MSNFCCKNQSHKFRPTNSPFTSCICSFRPTVRELYTEENFVLVSERAAVSLDTEWEGVISGWAFIAVYGATFDVVDGGIFDTVHGVDLGAGGNSSSLHGVDVLGSHDIKTSLLGRSGSGFRQDTGRNNAGGGWAGNGGGWISANITCSSTRDVCSACLNISCAL